jgi:apolipoprotein N-acyltransferase
MPNETLQPVTEQPHAGSTAASRLPTLFRDRSQGQQIILGGVIPAVIGALQGVLVGASSAAYWVVALLAGVGAFLSGFEHRDGWGGADRGFCGGLIYGVALLVVHWIVGTHAKVSLGSFPPLLAVVTAIIGMLLAAAGGRIARAIRERAGIFITDEPDD